MRLSGWLRLWIVAVVLYGIVVAIDGYGTRPTVEELHDRWIAEASDTIARKISRAHDRDVPSYQVRQSFFSQRSNVEAVEWLTSVADSPSDGQQLFAAEIGKVNQKYVELRAGLGAEQLMHILMFVGLWLVPSFGILALGVAVGWVIRGFREGTA